MNAELLGSDLFRGARVRLAQNDPEAMAQSWSRWGRDSLYHRLMDDWPPRQFSTAKLKEVVEKDSEPAPDAYFFSIRTIEDDRLIGFIELRALSWNNGEGWMGMAIGERSDWGQGYGSEVLRLLLVFAFHELNLHRVSLGVLAYNERARRAYEKVGFRMEGRERGVLGRDGERGDVYFMGILRDEWAAALPAA